MPINDELTGVDLLYDIISRGLPEVAAMASLARRERRIEYIASEVVSVPPLFL